MRKFVTSDKWAEADSRGFGYANPMRYADGALIQLGDVVRVPVPSGHAKARVVMLGETYEHLDIDPEFLRWVRTDRVLTASAVVVEWLDGNPFSSADPKFAPVGNYMFTPADQHLIRDAG
jgi:hypothetical protein